MKLSADTITDDQIRALRDAIESRDRVSSDYTMIDFCDLALTPNSARWIDGRITTTREGRARCAEILNGRSTK